MTLASYMTNSSWPSASPSKLEPFEDYLSTHRYLTDLRKKPE